MIRRENRKKRHIRVRAKVIGTAKIPRVSVFRSSKRLFVQIVDDSAGKTILSNKAEAGAKKRTEGGKTETARLVGETLAKKAVEAGISKVVFDRGGYKYHGRIKALAEGLRSGGLKF